MTFYMREEGSDHPFHHPTWKMASEQFILYRTTIFFLPYILQCLKPITWKELSPTEACPS